MNNNNDTNFLLHLLELSISIAVNVHRGQFDKAGIPYILHPLRVMNGVKKVNEKIVGVLHDTIEDHPDKISFEYLRNEGFPEDVIAALDSVTRRKGETYTEFIYRVKENSIGRKVKIVDLRDNSDLFRVHALEDKHLKLMKRYHNAMMILRKDGQVYITK
jgi:(p)ppGpp synthase/HD superfamily hydrolase